MKYSTRLSDAIHVLILIELNPHNDLTSNKIADSIKTNPSFIRQIMLDLKKAGIIISTSGHPCPKLARGPKDITLYDLYIAIEKEKPLLHLDTHTNPECGIGINIQNSIQDFYNKIQESSEREMKKITLEDILSNIKTK